MAETQVNPETPHETRDLPARPLVGILLGVSLFVPLCAAVLWLLFQTLWQNPPTPFSPFRDVSEREATAPPLIPNPAFVVPVSIQRMEERLHSVGWIDREAGIVHIPIEYAMDRLAARGVSEDIFAVKTDNEPKP